VDAQEDERRRLARELHDGLGQVLTAIKFSIEILEDAPNLTAQDRERLSDIRAQLEAAMKEVREISSNLMPSVLEDFGLSPALESLCHQTAKSTGLTVRFQTQGVVERLPSSVETGLYRIAQEALTNAAKHAEATEVEVQLFTRDRSLWLTVEDDGKGFDVEGGNVRRTTPGRIGLVSMKERVAALGGILTIETRPGAGTEILVELPLPEGE
jgi:signal transduction histidine kinase